MPSRPRAPRLPRLPALVNEKLNKTAYTRGAARTDIYQNRVTRNSTVLIPLSQWESCRRPDDGSESYENGFIVLVEPSWYFRERRADELLATQDLAVGENALLYYRPRADWLTYGPDSQAVLPDGSPLLPATSRRPPLGGNYVARVPATVASAGNEMVEGFATTSQRGAGIRVWEYASSDTIRRTKIQLEALMWLSEGADESMHFTEMNELDASIRKTSVLQSAEQEGLLDKPRLQKLRIINEDDKTICPLCLEQILGDEFFLRLEQAEGRAVVDLTTTQISLFHIQELRVGKLQHKVYNLGWGHGFCNSVVKDAGIIPTLQWMREVLSNQPADDLNAERQSVEEAVDR